MTTYLLDTNILIEWFTSGPAQEFLETKLEEADCRLATSWICAVEFCVKARDKEHKSLLNLIREGEMELYDIANGIDAVDDVSSLRAKTALPLPDCLILHAAKTNKATLLTRDKDLYKKGITAWADIVCV